MYICGCEKTATWAISFFYYLYRTVFLIKLGGKAQKIKKFHKMPCLGGEARARGEVALDILYKIKYNPCIQSTLIVTEENREQEMADRGVSET